MIGVLIIGDEILSGRRIDKHLPKVIELLHPHNIELKWVRYIQDNLNDIIKVLKECYALNYPVISFGGIGATPDDLTRLAAAMAANTSLELHRGAELLLREKFKEQITHNQLLMGYFPIGSDIIHNPINNIPGFKFHNVYFLPGFPELSHPMAQNIIHNDFSAYFNENYLIKTFIVPEAKESILLEYMEQVVRTHAKVKFSSLPSFGNDKFKTPHIEFSFSGAKEQVFLAYNDFKAMLKLNNYQIIENNKE